MDSKLEELDELFGVCCSIISYLCGILLIICGFCDVTWKYILIFGIVFILSGNAVVKSYKPILGLYIGIVYLYAWLWVGLHYGFKKK